MMTQDEIIEMLRASCDKDRVDPEQNGFWVIVTEELDAFAKLVAEKERERMTVVAMDAAEKAVDVAMKLEREACAKIADEWAVGWPHPSQSIAERIRERGQ
jgi:hypothetical protein